MPPTFTGLLTERLDRLGPIGSGRLAAVLGREFDRELLVALDPPAGEISLAVTQLAAHGVLGDRSRPITVEFAHALLQEAAYERMLRPAPAELHGASPRRSSADFPELAEREPEVVAGHWSAARRTRRVESGWWHDAGVRALSAPRSSRRPTTSAAGTRR